MGTTLQKRKIYLVQWERVTTSKLEGRLGIQKLKEKNQALLANTAWRLFHNPSSLWASVLISKYIFPNTKQTSLLSKSWKNVLWDGPHAKKALFGDYQRALM